jgi:RNA polymerase sigma-70 factor (ECF subfamily)
VRSVDELLAAYRDGDTTALDRLIPLIYAELRRLARSQMRRERQEHTLQTTAVVHEAYLRLVSQRVDVATRGRFLGLAAHVMRQVLVDQSRRRNAAKRGAGQIMVQLMNNADVAQESSADLVALDDALRELSAVDPRLSQVVELRYFAGLTIEETAEVVQRSSVTVRRDWSVAKAFLYDRIKR